MSKTIKTEIRLPLPLLEELRAIAYLAGVKLNTVIKVGLAVEARHCQALGEKK